MYFTDNTSKYHLVDNAGVCAWHKPLMRGLSLAGSACSELALAAMCSLLVEREASLPVVWLSTDQHAAAVSRPDVVLRSVECLPEPILPGE